MIRATYRLQLRTEFGFDAAAAVVPYLARLGVSHVYCSPYLQAAPGSTHGYDVVDHTKISDDLGGPEAHERFVAALEGHGMGHILDVVPNHMAVAGRANQAWWDVLKNGRGSTFARFFDIDWDPPDQRLAGKILLPVLGDQYGRVLEAGELGLAYEDGEAVVTYTGDRFPVAPGSIETFLGGGTDEQMAARITGDPALLHSLLEAQHYRLAYWRSDLELNYRRFFDINELVALRMEEPEVFAHVHSVPLRLMREGKLDGLRIDHVDGLRTPKRYLASLRDEIGDAYLIVEKILEEGEELPDWPCDGTTGYDFLNLVLGLFVDPSGAGEIDEIYRSFTGAGESYEDEVLATKRLVMNDLLASDVDRLVKALSAVGERHPRHRDYTRTELREAIRETITALEVYRTYVDPDTGVVSQEDIHYVEDAAAQARDRRDDIDDDLFEFLSAILLLRHQGGPEADFAARFQQATGPVMAKAVEDTAFYRFVRFSALNEVGGDPTVFGRSIDSFHRGNEKRAERWPRSMLATSTHDTKRSEDVRARLALLSEIPGAWRATVARWSEMNERHRTAEMPDRGAEYLLYQTLVGAWPLSAERAVAYMAKAMREAKLFTSWTNPDEAYDTALESFIEAVLADEDFTSDLAAFVEPLIMPGRINSLAMVLLKLTSPGIPDLYQGTELWDLSLVDPDNRKPVDYNRRASLLEPLGDAPPEEVAAHVDAGAPKLLVTHRALELRRERPMAFAGSYERLETGTDHLIGFVRGGEVAALAPRLVLSRPPDWNEANVSLPAGRWENVFTRETIEGTATVGTILRDFPVALLARKDP